MPHASREGVNAEPSQHRLHGSRPEKSGYLTWTCEPKSHRRLPSSYRRFCAPQNHALDLALRDEETGEFLSKQETLVALEEDIRERPERAQPCPRYAERLSSRISFIRSNNALVHPDTSEQLEDDWSLFSMKEYDQVCAGLRKGKSCFRGCYAAVLQDCLGAKLFNLALLNLSATLQLCPGCWAVRQYSHIRKKGPLAVSNILCLRPVPQGTDMSALQDGLILLRTTPLLREFWGPHQSGGVMDALMPVATVIMLGQYYIALESYLELNFADVHFGFDTVGPDDIRDGLFTAGVVGKLWLLVDDCLRQDCARVQLSGLVSRFFNLCGGVGQGKKPSVAYFNTAAVTVATALSQASRGVPLPAVPSQPAQSVKALQHVDDIMAPATSTNASWRVWRALQNYSEEHGPKFNLEKQKSTILVVGERSPPFAQARPTYNGIPISYVSHGESHKYMGVLLDSGFAMEQHFHFAISRWRGAFNKHIGVCQISHLPFLVMAATTPQYVEPVAFHGTQFCIGLKGLEYHANKIQTDWARTLLHCNGLLHGSWSSLISEVGWTTRLGSKLLLNAMMLEAQIDTLPLEVPARSLLLALRISPRSTWATALSQLRVRLGNLPNIHQWLEIDEHVDLNSPPLSSRGVTPAI